MREQIKLGTPPYREKLEQHAEFVTLKGVRVSVSRGEIEYCRDWAETCHRNSGSPRPYNHFDEQSYAHTNYVGILGARAVHACIGGQLICTPDEPDPGWDIVVGTRRFDVKWRQAFLTPETVLESIQGPEVPRFVPGVEQVLVNPVPNSPDLVVCGTIDRSTFIACMFELFIPKFCFAVTAQPLKRIETIR